MRDNYRQKGLRQRLVTIISQKGITDQTVLNAINNVPRHLFLDNAFLETAYEDKAFPIGEGQTISQPYTVAYQTQALEIKKGDKVLEIGTGSGYQAAVLAEMNANVYTIERHKPLHDKAKKFLRTLGYNNIKFFYGDGYKGLSAFAPFNKIIVTAAAPEVVDTLKAQLTIGGIMIIPVGEGNTQKMTLIKRMSEDEFSKEVLDNFSFVPMLKGKK